MKVIERRQAAAPREPPGIRRLRALRHAEAGSVLVVLLMERVSGGASGGVRGLVCPWVWLVTWEGGGAAL